MNDVTSWDNEYARLARAASQLRASASQQHPTTREQQAQSIQAGLTRLHGRLSSMQASRQIDPSDAARRKVLVENLVRQVGGSSTGGEADLLGLSGSAPQQQQQTLSASAQALRHQDGLIEELASGVSRLKDQTLLINDEAQLQNRMLDDMGGDVENTRAGLEAETLRAMKLKEDKSVWRLYCIIAGLSILLFLLVLTGLS